MADSNDKPVRGILYEWESHMQDVLHIRGRTLTDEPLSGTSRGNWLVTSQIRRFFRVDGILHVETLNSLYILVDENPFKKG
jgi:hypothetical protein